MNEQDKLELIAELALEARIEAQMEDDMERAEFERDCWEPDSAFL